MKPITLNFKVQAQHDIFMELMHDKECKTEVIEHDDHIVINVQDLPLEQD